MPVESSRKLSASYSLLSKDPGTVLVRVYGASTDDIIDKDYELQVGYSILVDRLCCYQILKALEKQNLRPRLFATFSNGYIFEFIEGRALTAVGKVLYCVAIAYNHKNLETTIFLG